MNNCTEQVWQHVHIIYYTSLQNIVLVCIFNFNFLKTLLHDDINVL